MKDQTDPFPPLLGDLSNPERRKLPGGEEAYQGVLALHAAHLELRAQLLQMAVIDPATGLFTRNYLEPTLRRELSRSYRAGKSLAVLAFHVDYLGGPPETDYPGPEREALFQLGVLFRIRFRADDVPCRLGGGDFAVLLPECTLPNGAMRAEQALEILLDLQAVRKAAPAGRLIASAGVACFPEHGADPESLIRAAREAALLARKEGRRVGIPPPAPLKTSTR